MSAPGPSNSRHNVIDLSTRRPRRFDTRQIIIGVILATGFFLMCIGIARAADYQLLVCEPARPCVLKPYVYDQKTACVTDSVGESIVRTKGSHVECVQIEAKRRD